MSVPQESIEAIRDRTNLVDLISETVQLKRAGKNFTGLCPFHSEKTPSFSVNGGEGFYHCFGCQKHGSAFDFVMETRGMTFIEAVRFLGARVGIEVRSESSEKTEQRKREEQHRKQLRLILRVVAGIYQENLWNERTGQQARRYLLERGLAEATIRLFHVGFVPDSPAGIEQILSELKAKHSIEPQIAEPMLVELGVVAKRDDGSTYESFRGRVIFPIMRSDGAPIALGGRILDPNSNRPKYINSKESQIYSKRSTIYGLNQALPYIRSEREALLVEGYMDVLALAQAGFPSAVATCGTSVTTEHVQLLRRFCDKLVAVFDADDAGAKAAANCFELFLNSGIEVFGLSLPPGEDPGSFLIGQRADTLGALEVQKEFEQLLATAREPILSVYLKYHLSQTDAGPAALGRLSSDLIGLMKRVRNPVEREATLRLGAAIMGVSLESLQKLDRVSPAPPRDRARESTEPRKAQNAHDVASAQERRASLERTSANPRPVLQERAREPEMEAPSVAARRLSIYLQQLFVSVVCEPSLSESLLEIPESLEQLATSDFTIDRLQSILREIARADFVPLEVYKSRSGSDEFRDFIGKWRVLFRGHGIDPKQIIAEAWNQVKVGGGDPDKVISDAKRVSAELTLSSQLEKIRTLEKHEKDGDELGSLVQRKLLERRNLKNIPRGNA